MVVISQWHSGETLINGSSNTDGVEGTDRRNTKTVEIKEVGVTVRKKTEASVLLAQVTG